MVAAEVIDRRYIAIGGAAEFLTCTDREVLCVSGAMTGKTHSLLRKAHLTALKYPKSRQFFARDTRVSMTESILVEFEESVLWPGHPAITGTATRANRHNYVYPHNGAEIVVFGLDDADRHMSTQYDRGYVFEATELDDPSTWRRLLSRMRNGRTPYHQLVADCNPGSEFHWLNTHFPQEGEPNPQPIYGTDPDTGETIQVSSRRRVHYRHEDNPRLFDPDTGRITAMGREYVLGTLGSLTGADRERLLFHRWVSAEGQVLPEFDPRRHCITRAECPPFVSYVAAIDFGYNAPGCFQVWGIDADRKRYRLFEVYQRGLTSAQWAEIAATSRERFWYLIGVGDCADPDAIRTLNIRLGAADRDPIFHGCDKSRGVLWRLDVLRDSLKQGQIFFVKDAAHHYAQGSDGTWMLVQGIDMRLKQAAKPACTEQEIPSFVFRKNEDGKPVKDEPDPSCADHGIDATSYFDTFALIRDMRPINDGPKYPPGSYGDVGGYEEVEDEYDS